MCVTSTFSALEFMSALAPEMCTVDDDARQLVMQATRHRRSGLRRSSSIKGLSTGGRQVSAITTNEILALAFYLCAAALARVFTVHSASPSRRRRRTVHIAAEVKPTLRVLHIYSRTSRSNPRAASTAALACAPPLRNQLGKRKDDLLYSSYSHEGMQCRLQPAHLYFKLKKMDADARRAAVESSCRIVCPSIRMSSRLSPVEAATLRWT
ncbi:hypothetical protein EXIGLDRAFT_435194 [Exidia glandulosa HHB12029]|uniref:Uncharacterized protein n=1 Tax=Exidia glandulosa HHB12029 TaxID=1314781 RepID=A0A165KFT0_EXIGL|nr:hypothetical protein EXIGLDRAFT_435194 [Exidia glandulosa HHB12029]